MSFPMNFDLVLANFASTHRLAVYDTCGAYSYGAWQEAAPVRRKQDITAIVLAMTTASLEFYKEGNSSNSGITLHTKETLYFNDANNTEPGQQPGQQAKQSYVQYQGYLFKVVGTGFMMGNTNFNIYNCLRYLS